jgi:hypothetical protein
MELAPTVPASWSFKSHLLSKMGYFYLLTTALLFFVLTPGILLSLPPGGSKMTVAAVHAIVFAVVHKMLHAYMY